MFLEPAPSIHRQADDFEPQAVIGKGFAVSVIWIASLVLASRIALAGDAVALSSWVQF